MEKRKLLELAAKAAGIQYDIENDKLLVLTKDQKDTYYWDPIDDDGDSMRLAVRLWLNIKMFNPCDALGGDDIMTPGFVEIWREDDEDPLVVEYFRNVNLRYEITRLAIVKAAAEIRKDLV